MFRRAPVRDLLLTAVAIAFTAPSTLAQTQLNLPDRGVNQPTAAAKEPDSIPAAPAPVPFNLDDANANRFCFPDRCNAPSTFLIGTKNFQNFIGFISNPLQSIDPRSSTQVVAIFGNGWLSANDTTGPNGRPIERSLLPSGNMQVYGGGPMAIALNDRLCIGLNQGGYAVANFSRDRANILNKLGLPIPNRDLGGTREGWLDLGGYVQYTLIADVPNQFLVTAGMRWEAPAGATQLFQGGANPAYLAPYVTVGKEFGNFHVLATTGYEFPAGRGNSTTDTFYLNLHLDRKIGWLYPLIEFNAAYHNGTVNPSFTTPLHDVINLGTFSTSANSLVGAFGANFILVPGKVEFGVVYMRPLVSQDRFDTNSVLLRMLYRF